MSMDIRKWTDRASNLRNLHKELVELLAAHGKSVADIDWIRCACGDGYCSIPMENFIAAAESTFYDAKSYGFPEIAESLQIFGKNRSFLVYVYNYDGRQNLSYVDMEVERPKMSRNVASLDVASPDDTREPVWADLEIDRKGDGNDGEHR